MSGTVSSRKSLTPMGGMLTLLCGSWNLNDVINRLTGQTKFGDSVVIELKGKYNSAKIFTDVVDQASISQVMELLNQEFVSGSRIRLMPDIHAGKGCTIGTTMTITDRAVPNLVAVDIGCGMETAHI